MDEKRLAELEKLAGLELEGSQRAQFLVELQALEDLASRLPTLTSTPGTQAPAEPDKYAENPPCPLAGETVVQNAPETRDRLFIVPGFKDGTGSRSS